MWLHFTLRTSLKFISQNSHILRSLWLGFQHANVKRWGTSSAHNTYCFWFDTCKSCVPKWDFYLAFLPLFTLFFHLKFLPLIFSVSPKLPAQSSPPPGRLQSSRTTLLALLTCFLSSPLDWTLNPNVLLFSVVTVLCVSSTWLCAP